MLTAAVRHADRLGAMSAVQDMIARLDAAKLQAEEEARKRAHEEAVAAWEAEQEAERQKAEAAAAAEKAAAEKAEAEKAKWHVDEGECAADVAARKDAFLRKNKPKTRPKTVIIKDLQTIVVDVGSNNTKVGFAGEDAPRWMFSTVVGRIRSDHLMDLEKVTPLRCLWDDLDGERPPCRSRSSLLHSFHRFPLFHHDAARAHFKRFLRRRRGLGLWPRARRATNG